MEERIAACALQRYETGLPLKGKPKDTEWTVYAAIVTVEKNIIDDKVDDETTSTKRLWVASCATGTKCANFVSPKDESSNDAAAMFEVEATILRDCHAEALARRGLLKVMWKEIAQYQKDPTSLLDSNNRLLDVLHDSSATNPKFSLRSDIALHLYVSDPPCGDASIYPLLDTTTSQNDSTETDSNSSKKINISDHEINFTGAKVIINNETGVDVNDCGGDHQLLSGQTTKLQGNVSNSQSRESTAVVAREDVQLLGKLRTKSGRSNLPAHLRSSCMSCSDKLVRWCVLGLQGSLLACYIPDPIRLESIVVSHDMRALSKSEQKEALCRAIPRRVVSTMEYLQKQVSAYDQAKVGSLLLSGDQWKGPSVQIVDPRFARGKSSMEYERRRKHNQAQPSSPSSATPAGNQSSQSSKKRKRESSSKSLVSPCGICLNWDQSVAKSTDEVYVEQIVGARGLCQGKKPKSARDYRLATSRLSRATLAVHALAVHKAKGGEKEEEEKAKKIAPYKEWKQAHGDTTYQCLRSLIFAGGPLAGWLSSSS